MKYERLTKETLTTCDDNLIFFFQNALSYNLEDLKERKDKNKYLKHIKNTEEAYLLRWLSGNKDCNIPFEELCDLACVESGYITRKINESGVCLA